MIYVKYNPDEVRLQVRGHAEQAPIGQDIVCAGVSALYGALNLHPMVREHMEHDWRILTPVNGAQGVMKPMFDMIANGITDIARQYEQNVTSISHTSTNVK